MQQEKAQKLTKELNNMPVHLRQKRMKYILKRPITNDTIDNLIVNNKPVQRETALQQHYQSVMTLGTSPDHSMTKAVQDDMEHLS